MFCKKRTVYGCYVENTGHTGLIQQRKNRYDFPTGTVFEESSESKTQWVEKSPTHANRDIFVFMN